eukprot:COSAG02_NODE_7813_length_2836_cov_13.362862_1_plen_100_part_00
MLDLFMSCYVVASYADSDIAHKKLHMHARAIDGCCWACARRGASVSKLSVGMWPFNQHGVVPRSRARGRIVARPAPAGAGYVRTWRAIPDRSIYNLYII